MIRHSTLRTQRIRKRPQNGRPEPSYLSMVKRFALRPLRSECEYDAAVAVLDALAVRPEGSLDPGEQDYFDTLTMLVEAYDRDHYDRDTKLSDPLTMLKYVMQESGMTQAELGRLLGNRSLASMIL